jgi:hypothetical protein
VSDPVFHVQLRQFPNAARAFNLSRDELEERFAQPWRAGRSVEFDDRRWEPGKARIAVFQGRSLAPEEIGMGRGWANAARTGREVTEEILAEPSAVDRFKAELPTRATLADLVTLAAERYPGARVSERVALAEQVTWELLHSGQRRLIRGGQVLDRDEWAGALLSWKAWSDPDLWLESAGS